MSTVRAIAIDGPVAAGKGTIATLLSKKLHGFALNTGAMYRALTFYCLENNISIQKTQEVTTACKKIQLDLDENKTYLNGVDITDKIKQRIVSQMSAKVAAIREVREEMVKQQQNIGFKKIEKGLIVIAEGRDAATKIFPNAKLKIFLTARPEIRANRRFEQMGGIHNHTITYQKILDDTLERDKRDYERQVDPLVKDPEKYGYVVLDNSNLTEEKTIEAVLKIWKQTS